MKRKNCSASLSAVGFSFTRLKVSCKLHDPQNLHAVLRAHTFTGQLDRLAIGNLLPLELRARERSKGWNAITKTHQPSAQTFPWKYSRGWAAAQRCTLDLNEGNRLSRHAPPCTLCMWAREIHIICACARAGVIYSLEADATCVYVACIMYSRICISRLLSSEMANERIRPLLSHSFVGTATLCSVCVDSHSHMELHEFDLICFTSAGTAAASAHTQRSIVRNSSLCVKCGKYGKKLGLSVDFLHSFHAVLRNGLLLEVINLELNLACTDVRVHAGQR